jgi:RNA polymerase sigma factor (sigma-70 family)
MGLPPSSGPPTSTTLLREIRDLRNRDEWRRFVDTYTPYLKGILRRRGFSQEDTLDLMQETFVAVVDHIGDFQYDPSRRFRGWLATIALRKASRHALRDKRRLPARGGTANLGVLGGLPGNQCSNEDEERRLSILLGRLRAALNELEWKVFESTALEDTPFDEAAAKLGIAAGYLYVCRSRARKALLRLLEEGDE